MSIKRLDHVVIVVEDLPAAIDFFTVLGLAVEGQQPVEGAWLDKINGLKDMKIDIVMMATPDGHGKVELTKFHQPALVKVEPANAPPNALGYRSVMFAVDSLDETLARLKAHGTEVMNEVVQFQNLYKLCYVRGPGGIIISLAEQLF